MAEGVSETVVCPDDADPALVGDEPLVVGASAVEVSVVDVSVVVVSVGEVALLEPAVAPPIPEVTESEVPVITSLVLGLSVWVVPVGALPELELSVMLVPPNASVAALSV